MVSDAARRADLAQAARASENASMSTYEASRRADLAQQARAAENASMRTLDAAIRTNDPSVADVAYYGRMADVRSMAVERGIDPDVAVAVAKSEGLQPGTWQSKYTKNGVQEPSYGPMQMLKGGPGTGYGVGLGNEFQKATGLDPADPKNVRELTAFALDQAAKDKSWGAWYGAKRAGIADGAGLANAHPVGDTFASRYMGGKTSTATTAERNAATTQERAKTQQNDPSGLPPGTYRGYDPSGLPADTPASGPIPTGRPAQPRSLGQKVVAGVIDAGLGMLPGVGTAASVINGGLALTGNRTLGERVVDSFGTGTGASAGPDSGSDRRGGGDRIAKNRRIVPKKEESFESRYLAFIDPTPRPKPAEKWQYDTSGYA